MRGNSDLSETYPFSISPANGWGNANPTGEYIVSTAAQINHAVKLDDEGDGFAIVPNPEATRFASAPLAAIASGKIAKTYRDNKVAA